MVMFAMRFDFRNPPIAETSMADRYAAALDMAEWADGLGCVGLTVSEHHGSDDGYLPSPLPMLAAMAARTKTVPLSVAALIAPFHDPLRIAEDIAVVDNISKGRVSLYVAGGYARHEFEMFDVPMKERPARVTEMVKTLKQAFTGEPFEFRGRTVQVTPAAYQQGGPPIMLGGSSEAAARRAARIADGFMPSEPQFWEFYADECRQLGKPDPGPFPGGDTSTTTIALDPEKGWEQRAPYFLHECNAYGAWQVGDDVAGGFRPVADADELRTTGQYRVLSPDEMIAELKAAPFPFAMFHPMVGGMPPDLAWESLRLFEHEVLPALE